MRNLQTEKIIIQHLEEEVDTSARAAATEMRQRKKKMKTHNKRKTLKYREEEYGPSVEVPARMMLHCTTHVPYMMTTTCQSPLHPEWLGCTHRPCMAPGCVVVVAPGRVVVVVAGTCRTLQKGGAGTPWQRQATTAGGVPTRPTRAAESRGQVPVGRRARVAGGARGSQQAWRRQHLWGGQ